MKKNISGYYFITDSRLSRAGIFSDTKAAARAGVKFVQYRAKGVPGKIMCEESAKLKKLCGDAIFIVNDRVDVALASGADGVHVGQDDIPCLSARKMLGKNKIIGVTVGSVAEAAKAIKDGADYIAVSPVFSTATKKDAGRPVGLRLLSRIKKISKVPVAAIGGIDLENAESVIEAGADSVCAISCVVTKKDVGSEIRKFKAIFKGKI